MEFETVLLLLCSSDPFAITGEGVDRRCMAILEVGVVGGCCWYGWNAWWWWGKYAVLGVPGAEEHDNDASWVFSVVVVVVERPVVDDGLSKRSPHL
jgi:hypothetical protein